MLDLITSVPQINGVRFTHRMAAFGDDSAKREDAEVRLDRRSGATRRAPVTLRGYQKLPKNSSSERRGHTEEEFFGSDRWPKEKEGKKGHYYKEEKSQCLCAACFYQNWVGAQP